MSTLEEKIQKAASEHENFKKNSEVAQKKS